MIWKDTQNVKEKKRKKITLLINYVTPDPTEVRF